MDYTLEIENRDQAVLAKLQGLLTIYTVTALKEELGKILESKPKRFLLDLSLVEKVDTAGIQVLFLVKKYCEELQVSWEIQNHPPEILKFFDLYGLVGYFEHPVRIQSKDKERYAFSYGTKKG